jgi:hypothetical protein
MSTTPGKAQQVIGVLRTLFAFAMDEGTIEAWSERAGDPPITTIERKPSWPPTMPPTCGSRATRRAIRSGPMSSSLR